MIHKRELLEMGNRTATALTRSRKRPLRGNGYAADTAAAADPYGQHRRSITILMRHEQCGKQVAESRGERIRRRR